MYGNQSAAPATPAPDAGKSPRKPVNIIKLHDMAAQGEKIVMLTCYDASFAALLDQCEVDVLLIGDSLGMVLQGEQSTLPVTMEHLEYHTRCVARGNKTAWVLADMPWGSYHQSPEQAYANAARLMAAGANMVKIEGGHWLAPTVEFLATRGIPVCAHIGLTPQFVNQFGGYRVQGKTDEAAQQLLAEAQAHEHAGADMLLFEAIPAVLATTLTHAVRIPTIGIGAGADCSGQVLVLHDMLNIFPGRKARFVKNFMEGQPTIEAAIRAYVAAVKSGTFPATEHTF